MEENFQKAFVIHSRAYKETSLIVTFLSERNGKINAVAKGAKRKKIPDYPVTLNHFNV